MFLRPRRFQDGEQITVAGVAVRLIVNARARRVSLRLDPARGQVVATAPSIRRLADAAAFAGQRAEWIVRQSQRIRPPSPLHEGASLTILGAEHRLEQAGARRLQGLADGTPRRLRVHATPEAFAAATVRLLKAEALRHLTGRTHQVAGRLGHPPPKVGIGDARTRWGSCTQPRGAQPASIRYSWRLLLAPAAVCDYVVAHECAHLVHADHSERFWSLVAELYGDPRRERAWLKAHGAALHAIGAPLT